MTQEQAAKIFEPFTQADASTTRKYGGTGLGLAIVGNTLDLMGSRLNVESTLGVGTKFSFTVTFGIADEALETSEIISSTREISKPLFKGEILVFEDNIVNQQVVTEHLTKIGLKTEIAENGQEGVEKIKRRIDRGETPYDLIFIDIHMPVMDGIEATSRIIELGSRTPIVAVTANVLTEDRELYKKLGMVDYLGKPFTSQELWRCLLRHLQPVSFEALEDNYDTLQNKLKADFAKANQNKFGEITKAIDAGDISRAHRLVHTLKSNAGLIGQTELQKVAANIEIALKNGGAPPSETQMSIFQYELNKTLNELMPLLNEAPNPAGPEIQVNAIDRKAALELFDKLEPLLSSGNPECLKLIDELRRIPDSGELIGQMEDFYFGDALKTLMELKELTERHGENHDG
jgi:CheY-like chemotaxis protein